MVNPGAFQGARKALLVDEKVAYAAAVEGGYAADQLAAIQRRFFKRFPIDKDDSYEPTPEALAAINDEEPDPELQHPDREKLSEDEFVDAMAKLKERQTHLEFKRAQIKRWLAYQYMKDHALDPKDTGAHNPYHAILHKLTGKGLTRPRQKTATNVWRKTQRRAIEATAKARAGETKLTKGKFLALMEKVAKEEFANLSDEDRKYWEEQATTEYELALMAYKRDKDGPPSTAPEDRQRCIQALSQFVEPILELICEAMGWKATLLAGGPEPAFGGRLHMLSVHSGTTSGDVPMKFGCAERKRYKSHIVPVFGNFLQSCYTIEECRSRALMDEDGPVPLDADELESSGVNLDTIGMPSTTQKSGTPPDTSSTDRSSPNVPIPPSRAASPRNSTPDSTSSRPLASSMPIPPSQAASPRSLPPESIPCRPSAPNIPVPPSRTPFPPNSSQGSVASRPPTPFPVGRPGSLSPGDDDSRPPSRSPSPVPHPMFNIPDSPVLVIDEPIPSATVPPALPSSLRPCEHPSTSPSTRVLNPPPPSASTVRPATADTTAVAGTKVKKRKAAPVDENIDSRQPKKGVWAVPSRKGTNRGNEGKGVKSDKTAAAASRKGGNGGKKRKQVDSNEAPALDEPDRPRKRLRSAAAVTAAPPAATAAPPAVTVSSIPPAVVSTTTLLTTSSTSASSSSPTVSTAATSSASADQPEWVRNGVVMFGMEPLGADWQELVRAWVAFEAAEGFKDNGKLGTKHRPAAIAGWIQRRRSAKYRPPIDNISTYEAQFLTWWASLQPAWRLSQKGTIVFGRKEGDWKVLREPGPNGVLSVMAGLFFWGVEIHADKKRRVKWSSCVQDFRDALRCLLGSSQ